MEKKKRQGESKQIRYWLLKTEPSEWSWEDQASNKGVSKWDGVKNKQAQKNMKAMKLNDLCFFYHSGAKSRRIVGVVEVVREWYEDDESGGGCVDVKAVGEMRNGINLQEMKRESGLKDFVLFRQPRLSVVPVGEDLWVKICEMGGGYEGDGGGESEAFHIFGVVNGMVKVCSWSKRLERGFCCGLVYGCVIRMQGDEFWHMTKVLRLRVNGRVELFNGKGGLIDGSIQRIDRTRLDIMAVEDPKLVPPQNMQWHVFSAFDEFLVTKWILTFLGMLKSGQADWLVEKCTELGAHGVTPLLTERSPMISDNCVDRLQHVILAATKQCEQLLKVLWEMETWKKPMVFIFCIGQRLHEMALNPPANAGSILPIIAQSDLSFLAVVESTPVISALNSLNKSPSGVLIVGPEGEEEVNMITEAGAIAVGLGPHRLRVETATMVLLAALMLWSDL
ncbi:EVE domain [Dillenia turbinata]|uniref:16S rRNA (uracil(1498)-N(3))-methyltransferase n=1 Tax=Dillenia turbinata TaxID=194707 RepID=A0AAN8URS2_9MAGN